MKLMQKKAKYAEKNFITIYIDIRLLCCCGFYLYLIHAMDIVETNEKLL